MPEPYDGKLSCPVLRGFTLPDTLITVDYVKHQTKINL